VATVATLAISCKKKSESTYPNWEKITNSVYASGTVKSNNQYQVFSKANGVITALLVKEGDRVKKGQILLRLANDAVKLNYENAKLLADYSSVASNNEKLQQAQTEMSVAKLKLNTEQSLLERQKKLWAQEIGTQNELDQRVLAYENALSNFNASKLKVNDLQKQINFQSQQTYRTANISAVNMNDYLVKSDIDGVVYSIAKEQGEMVTMQAPIAVIGSPDRFYLDLQVDEYDIAKIKPGQKLVLTMDSYRGQVFEAIVTRIYPFMNEKSKSFKVEASFTTQPANLYPNLSAEANIIIEVKEKALTIPRSYLLEGGFVLLAENKKTKVTTGLMDYNKVEIISGITEKDQIFKPLQ
jgi:RND family efflux transporter MFP subunit